MNSKTRNRYLCVICYSKHRGTYVNINIFQSIRPDRSNGPFIKVDCGQSDLNGPPTQ